MTACALKIPARAARYLLALGLIFAAQLNCALAQDEAAPQAMPTSFTPLYPGRRRARCRVLLQRRPPRLSRLRRPRTHLRSRTRRRRRRLRARRLQVRARRQLRRQKLACEWEEIFQRCTHGRRRVTAAISGGKLALRGTAQWGQRGPDQSNVGPLSVSITRTRRSSSPAQSSGPSRRRPDQRYAEGAIRQRFPRHQDDVSRTGNVRMSQGTRWATGDHAVLDKTRHTVEITGNPVVHDGKDQVAGRKLRSI